MVRVTSQKRMLFGYQVRQRQSLVLVELLLTPGGEERLPLIMSVDEAERFVVKLDPFGTCEITFEQDDE